ncbi:MAG: formyltransferase family protein [Candidatus Nanohaloarchaea archaeon]
MRRALFVSEEARVAKQVEEEFDLVVSDRSELEDEFSLPFHDMGHDENAIMELLQENDVREVWCVGYMKLFSGEFIESFGGRMLNLHPSLLPAFKGLNVYERVLERGCVVSGATLHTISEEMDEGEIIDQVSYRVPENVSVEELKRYATRFEVMLLEEHL